MRFRKRPVEVEAIHVGTVIDRIKRDAWNDLPPWIQIAYQGGSLAVMFPAHLIVETLNGPVRATPDDWIVKGIHGELYPCEETIFFQTYEAIPDAQPREEVNCDG